VQNYYFLQHKNRFLTQNILFYFILFYFILFYFILFYFIKIHKQPKEKMLIFCGFGFIVFPNEKLRFLRSVKFSTSWGDVKESFDKNNLVLLSKKTRVLYSLISKKNNFFKNK